jgi:hypothetical protein
MMRKAAAIVAMLVGCSAGIVWHSRTGWHIETHQTEPRDTAVSITHLLPWFEAPGAAGEFDFVHCAGPIGPEFFFPQIMGSGCALFDFDRDGDLDLYLVDGSPDCKTDDAAPKPSRRPGNRLYRNEGSAKFVDISNGSGLAVSGVGMGVAVGDVNNDGYPDLYLTNYGSDRLFLNRGGDGTFVDITASAGIDNSGWGTSCSFVDYDRDGWLDLVVVNYVNYHPSQSCVEPNGRPDYCNPKLLRGRPAKLYHNETGQHLRAAAEIGGPVATGTPHVRFRDVSLDSQIAMQSGPGLGVVCADFDGDRWPDLFVANDGAPNFLWINRQDGTFREDAVARGVAYDSLGRPRANMGIAIGDVDGDGANDLVVTHLDGEGAALYLSRGGAFEEAAAPAGLHLPSFRRTGFGTALVDIDHDGALDLVVLNGRVRRREGTPFPEFRAEGRTAAPADFWAAYVEQNQMYVNDGSGRFRELRLGNEPLTRERGVWRGLALGDIDNDGDLDLLATQTAGPARIFRNAVPNKGHWIMVRAIEPALGGRDALGATVTLVAGQRRWVSLVNAGGSYLASSDPRAHFGLGETTTIDRIEVIWPDGSDEVFDGCDVNRFVTLEHGRGRGL